MGCVTSTCQQDDYTSIPQSHNTTDMPTMRLCSPGKDCSTFADVGDPVVLYVDFGPYCSPCKLEGIVDTVGNLERIRETAATSMPGTSHGGQQRYDLEVMIAGVVAELTCLHPARDGSHSYKASVKIPREQRSRDLVDGHCIPIQLPYRTNNGSRRPEYGEIKQDAIEGQYAVFFQPLWNELKDHNLKSIDKSTSKASRSSLMGGYGSMGRTSPAVGSQDQLDGSDQIASVEQEAITSEWQRREKMKPKRYWPDSWQMRCWRKAGCDKIIRSENPIARFIATFFVTPLTNVTGLSLYYQLYLSEIFHTRFGTRLFHYLCMPFIVLMMLVFFAQWRFVYNVDDISNHGNISCYKTGNTEVLILNGTMALGLLFWFWYLLWGAIQQTTLMGFFMIVPLFILYLLANIYFQVSIKNSMPSSTSCDSCWAHTSYVNGHIQYYKIFDLMSLYYNPVIWAWALSLVQSLSHIFEPKIPPRVSQTAHWMSCSQIFKRSGYTKALCILSAQAIFGAVDEFLASPRLLPIFVLRVCYELGYHKKQWKWMKKLVKRCLQYGDPALDYIGTGGAEYLSQHSIVFKEHVNIDELIAEVQAMELALTKHQKKLLESPSLLHKYKSNKSFDPFLEHFIVLRHFVAQYVLQVYAYGPFRLKGDDNQAQLDDQRMVRDFGDNDSFMNFLHQVRFSLWQMEDDLIEKRSASPCCKHTEEV